MALAKLSSAFLIERVAPQTRKAKTILFGMIVTWSVFSVLAVALECGLPRWTIESMQCGNGGLLISVIVLNMITDLVLAGWIVPTLWSLSLDKEKCTTAMLLFGARAMYVSVQRGGENGANCCSEYRSLPERKFGL